MTLGRGIDYMLRTVSSQYSLSSTNDNCAKDIIETDKEMSPPHELSVQMFLPCIHSCPRIEHTIRIWYILSVCLIQLEVHATYKHHSTSLFVCIIYQQ